MSFFSDIKSAIRAINGNTSLKEASICAPIDMGCYKIFYKNKLKYTGIAETGIRKKLKNIYAGNITNNKIALKMYENRDNLTVSWMVFKTRQECRENAKKFLNRYKTEWNMEEIENKNK